MGAYESALMIVALLTKFHFIQKLLLFLESVEE
jgi:hypothetical protein